MPRFPPSFCFHGSLLLTTNFLCSQNTLRSLENLYYYLNVLLDEQASVLFKNGALKTLKTDLPGWRPSRFSAQTADYVNRVSGMEGKDSKRSRAKEN